MQSRHSRRKHQSAPKFFGGRFAGTWRWRGWSVFPKLEFWKIFTAFFVTLFIGYFDILGVRSNSSALTEQVVQSILAPLYHSAAQKAVTVVLLDRAFFNTSKDGSVRQWPLSARDFNFNILTPIVEAGPAAVFIDIAFTDAPRYVSSGAVQPDSKAALREIAQGAVEQSQYAPIVVGDARAASDGAQGNCLAPATNFENLRQQRVQSSVFADEAVKAMAGTSSAFEFAMSDWDGSATDYPATGLYVGAQDSCASFSHNFSVHASNAFFQARNPSGYLVTPAVALLGAVCRSGKSLPGVGVPAVCPYISRLYDPAATGGYGLYALDKKLASPLYVRWGVEVSSLAQELYGGAEHSSLCSGQYTNTTMERVSASLLEVLFSAFPGVKAFLPDSTYKRPCPYINTISASVLADPRRAGFSDEQAAKIRKSFLQDRIVLVGTDVPFVKDTISSPVNGEVPGVYLHAMALENFLNLGVAYPRQPRQWGVFILCTIDAIAVVFLAYWGRVFVRILEYIGCTVPVSHRRTIAGLAGFMVIVGLLVLGILTVTVLSCWSLAYFLKLYFGSPLFVVLAAATAAIDASRDDYFHPAGRGGGKI